MVKISSTEAVAFEHDLFIVHAQADEPFVRGHLLPAIGLAPERVMLSSELALGAMKVEELERGVASSRLTVVVMSPAFTADRLAELAELLAGHPGDATDRLVPLLLADCKLPLRLDIRVSLDFRDPACWAEACQRLRGYLDQPAPAPVDVPCPYPGMRPYAADTAAHFYGRDAEIDELIGRLRAGEREIYVIGPSGSGKSSVVAAGLLPRLRRGVSGLEPFLARTMRPGEQPTTQLGRVLEAPEDALATPAGALEALLARHAPGASLLVVVDQLEELFTLASADERARFLAALRALRAEARCALVLTLRADFYGAFMESPLWRDLRGRLSRLEIGPLDEAELRAAIAHPARDVGVYFEPALIERLLDDAASEPGLLPLLQETLVQLWDRRQLRLLTLADYEALGDGGRSGLAVALARRADATLRKLTPMQEAIARRILLRLISFGEGRSNTRRQQPRSKLRAAGDDAADFDAVLRHLIDNRLLTAGDPDDHGDARIDLAHEIMITAWPTLAGWIQTRRIDEQRRRQLEAAAAQWVERGRGAGGLLDPIELAEAEAWRQTESARELGEHADVAALVAASRAARDRRAEEAEAGRRRIQHLLAQSYQEAGRQLLLDGRAQEAIPYLVAARQHGEEGAPLRMLFWMAVRSLPLTPPLEHQGPVNCAVFSPDGTRVLTASDDHTARVWDAATGKPLAAPLEHRGEVRSAAFSPDGTRVVTASWDNTARVWDATIGKLLAVPLEHQRWVDSAAFSPDGTRIVTASLDRTARVWDAATGKPLASPLVHQEPVSSAAFSPDGTRVLTASKDNTARVWDAATGKLLASPLQHQGWVNSAAFSPDGTRVVTASFDRTARVWDAVTGKPLASPLQHQGPVSSAVFSPDGTHVITTSSDRTARVWDATTGKPLAPPLQHQGEVWSAAFSPDGARVVTASLDHTARIWGAITGTPLASPLEHQRWVRSAAFSPDGTRVVTASDDNTARIWGAITGTPLASPLEHQRWVRSAAFSPDGTRVVTASDDNTARVWDAATGKPPATILEHQGPVLSATFSPDGTRVVTASDDKTARIWDAATGKPLTAPLEHQEWVSSGAFSADGTRVVTASGDKTARIWDAATSKPLTAPLEHQGPVSSAAFSADGTRVVTASFDRTARVWDAATGKPLISPLVHQEIVGRAAFSPDGTRVITVSDDDTARVWDAATGKSLVSPLVHQGKVNSAAFSPDGTRIVTASGDNTACVWDAATGKPLAPPLQHQEWVKHAAFSPDGTRVVTASFDNTARVWETRLHEGTLAEWSALAERSPFVLSGSMHVLRAPPASDAGSGTD